MTAPKLTARTAAEWAAVLPVWLGMLGLVFCAIFWAITNRIEPSLLTVFGGLLAAGQGAQALQALKAPNVPQVTDPPRDGSEGTS